MCLVGYNYKTRLFISISYIKTFMLYIYLECTETQTETHDIRWECFLKTFVSKREKEKKKYKCTNIELGQLI